jgi:predicted nucleotidyltransferase component of viral defense system
MISEDLINIISENNLGSKDLIEKDLILHKILIELSENDYFRDHYLFKGGTCLTKAYFGYFRFSEDLDFTFINQGIFKNKSKKDIRKIISNELDKLIIIIGGICKNNNLFFVKNKQDKEHFNFGAGNIFTTMKIFYNSFINQKQFIKFQVNFLEEIFFPIKELNLISLTSNLNKNLFPKKYDWIFIKPLIKCYNEKEILSEKIRAILTRKGIKSRDFIDVYMITRGDINQIELIENEIVSKINFSIKHEKYSENLNEKINDLPKFNVDDESKILLIKLDKGFYTFINHFDLYLKNLIFKSYGK